MTTTDRPVRVPNVSPGAKSGLAGEVIGANAIAAYDENQRLDAGDDTTPALDLPDTDRIAWVAAGETHDDRSARADAVYAEAESDGTDLAVLSAALRDAVYGSDNTGGGVTPPALPEGVTDTVPGLLAWVHEPEAHDEQADRAALVLAVEATKPEDDQRTSLVGPLTAEFPPPPADTAAPETIPGTTVITNTGEATDLAGNPAPSGD